MILPEKGTPSTTYNGLLFPFTEPKPLILIVPTEPGCPDPLITVTPATSPTSAFVTFGKFLDSKFSLLTVVAVPAKALFVVVP